MLADILMVIDMQNGVVNNDVLINRINQRIDDYRKEKKKIVYIQHHDEELIRSSKEWEIMSRLDLNLNDVVIEKTHANAFYHTKLLDFLKSKGVHSIEVCGAQTQFCVDTTIKMAHGLGFDLQMKHGMTTTNDNQFLNTQELIEFYEEIWNNRFLTFID